MLKLFQYSVLFILCLGFFNSSAQNSMLYIHEDYNYQQGIDLFKKEKYAIAQQYFQKVIDHYGNEHTDVKADAEYYAALCAIELYNSDAEYRIAKFIKEYPESPLTRVAFFDMGKYQYRKENYQGAIYYFNKVWKQNLTPDQLNEFYFKLGYSYFKMNDNTKAAKAFFEIINKEGKFKAPAQYFYAHIAYLDKNYETALKGFELLRNDPTFSPVVPYYIVQIYYLQGKTDKVLELGPALLNDSGSKREAEISRLIGEALYKNNRFIEALPYLEKYKEKADVYTREDIYQLGYVYYQTQNYQKAIETLSNITNVNDGLAQNAFFHIADSYLKLGQKEQARMAFDEASKLDFDGEIKEISMLNYAKLSYELSYSPFNETIVAFHSYLNAYPNSIRRDEAYGYLAKVFLTSKNYKEALQSLMNIKVKSPEMMEAYQRVSFYRGLELFNNLQFEAALAAFEVSLGDRQYDRQITALALYWKAEVLYRLDRFNDAEATYNAFLRTPGAYSLEEYNKTYYNLGYTYFKLKRYTDAISWFRKYTDKGKSVEQVKRADAFIRIGDCYFVTSQYSAAVEFYNNSIKMDTFDVEYALFQKGFSYGLLKQYNDKARTLTVLMAKNPQSSYAADALFERGHTYIALDSSKLAINDYERLIREYPNSSYVSKSLLQLGLLYYSAGDNEKALADYKRVVNEYNGTDEAQDALLGIKNIYVDLNQVDEYFAYINAKGGNNGVSYTEKDSLTYLAAERVYLNADWNKANLLMTQYLKQYSNGKFAVSAHFYRGDTYLQLNNPDSALVDFNYVVDKPKNLFTEQALVNASELCLKASDYKKAFDLYTRLENNAEVKSNLLVARMGQMQAAFKDSNYNAAIEAARRVLITEKVREEEVRAAQRVLAVSYERTNMLSMALTNYRILALDVKNAEGAEAKYKVGELLLKQNNLDDAEKEIQEFISIGTPHQYWLAKSFLVLADVYYAKGDNFQAKANLLGLMRNYKNTTDGIMKEAEARYDKIVTEENQQFKKDKAGVDENVETIIPGVETLDDTTVK